MNNTKETLSKKIEQLQNNTLTKIKDYTTNPEKYLQLIDFIHHCYNYSLHNRLLIYAQNPSAIAVGSFTKFKNLNYTVKKGEKGIKIMVPVKVTLFKDKNKLIKMSNATKLQKQQIKNGKIKTIQRTYFKLGTVFDITQTNMPIEKHQELYPENNTITDVNHNLEQIEQGIRKADPKLKTDSIVNNTNTCITKTVISLVHKLIKTKMQNTSSLELSDQTKNLLIELTVYSMLKSLKIDTSDKTKLYIASWKNKDGQKISELSGKKQSDILQIIDDNTNWFIKTIANA